MTHPAPERVLQSIYAAVDEFNASQPESARLTKDPETILLGTNGKLDSLGLVNLLITVEQQVSADFDVPLTLASEKAFSMRNSPFASLKALSGYILGLLEEARHV